MTMAMRRAAFLDEVAEEAPAVVPALEIALAELLDADLPTLDARLGELLAAGTVAEDQPAGDVVALAAAGNGQRRHGRRLAIAGGAMVTVLAATTGLAAASVLPAAVQRAVAEAASHVGVQLPRPDRAEEAGSLLRAPSAVPAAVEVPSTTGTSPLAANTTTSRSAADPAPTSPSSEPPATGEVGRPDAFLSAVAAFRACVQADGDASGCQPPDPADFGVPASRAPAEVVAFRAAIASYVACLHATQGRDETGQCVRPRPADYGVTGPRNPGQGAGNDGPTTAAPPATEPTPVRRGPGAGQRPPTTPPAMSVPPDRSSPGVSNPRSAQARGQGTGDRSDG